MARVKTRVAFDVHASGVVAAVLERASGEPAQEYEQECWRDFCSATKPASSAGRSTTAAL
jgi:hypothetical protein